MAKKRRHNRNLYRNRTVEMLRDEVRQYKDRGELYRQNRSLYQSAYARGALDVIPLGRKKHRFVASLPLTTKIIGLALSCETLKEFRLSHPSAYDAGLRYGIDFQEVFEKRDDATYLRGILIETYQDRVQAVA